MSAARLPHEKRPARLGDLTPGGRGIVRRVSGDPVVLRRLMELGFVPGTQVELVRCAPMGDPIEFRIRDTHFSIRRSEANRIDVDPV
ncbi:MAG: ferrous iron transport protein A [Candidatus Latescibacteria bacterium]|nr:ferrous iron transport protein A [Candidatus Latescibacterota bacterium]